MKRIAFNMLICAVAYPIDLAFLGYSTVRLTRAGFGFIHALQYSLQRGG